jgi:hypothetical protein
MVKNDTKLAAVEILIFVSLGCKKTSISDKHRVPTLKLKIVFGLKIKINENQNIWNKKHCYQE